MTAILAAPTRTYLATLTDGTTARVTIPQGYHPALGGGEIARVKAAIAQPIQALAIVG